MELIVKKSPYPHKGRRIPVGDRIEVSNQLGRVLVAVGLASAAPPVVHTPAPKKAAGKSGEKRAYLRRDMTAEQGGK